MASAFNFPTAGAAGSGPPAASDWSSGPTAAPTAQQQQRLRFGSVLASGRDGTVFSGFFNGQPVAIKVYGWEGVEAYTSEVCAYNALERLQGSVVPKVLTQGQLTDELAGVHCIVMEMVEGGRRLSDLPRPFPPQVVKAALRALQDVQTAAGDLVHGDIRLENMLLVGGEVELAAGGGGGSGASTWEQGAARDEEAGWGAGAAGAAPTAAAAQTAAGGTRDGAAPFSGGDGSALRCVLLDFGGSWLGGTEEEQAEELAELRRLLGVVEEGSLVP